MKTWKFLETYASAENFNQIKKVVREPYDLKVIGITGTVGKTTVTELVNQYLDFIGKKVFYIGTSGVKCKCGNYEHPNFPSTSPTSIEMLTTFMHGAYFYDCEYLVIEVTAETIFTNIYKDLDFELIGITNLLPNIVRSFKDDITYFKAKLSLFSNNRVDKVITTSDNSNLITIFKETNKPLISIDYSYKMQNEYLTLDVDNYSIETNLISSINAKNAGLFYGILKYLNILDINKMKEFLNSVIIPGRLESFELKGRKFVIDTGYGGVAGLTPFFEETKDKNIIAVMSSYFFNNYNDISDNLVQKRKERAALVYEHASKMCITATHRRTENLNFEKEQCVLDQLQAGAPTAPQIYNRINAIEWACQNSKPGDLIVILGMGSETWANIIGTDTYIGDKEIVYRVMEKI